MRIDSNNKMSGLNGAYDISSQKASQKSDNPDGELKQDRVELSQSAAAQDELSLAKNEIVREVEKGTSPNKLRRIQASIQNGSYRVDSSDIADAMLGDK